MEKRKILSKLNIDIKDYNNELEKILENKLFSYDVKNLLLSMLYKIENAYMDYKTTKVEALSKDEYIENILRIIKEKCLKVFLVKPGTPEAEELEKIHAKYKLDKENGEIVCFPNELTLLVAILEIDERVDIDSNLPYNYVLNPLNLFIKEGKIDSMAEVIRDFNGWSWDIDTKKVRNIYSNYMYQSLLLINGKNKILNVNSELYDVAIKMAMKEYISKAKDSKFNSEIKKIKKEKEDRLELFKNKKEFLNNLTNEKKKCTKNIEKIDKLLNNNELLKKEYYARNEKLPNKEKIFSISYLVKALEEERSKYLEKIEENNRIILPKEFIKEKTKLEKEVEFLESVFIENSEEDIVNTSKIFLKLLKEKVKKINEGNKNELIKCIYKLRYYRYIPIDQNRSIRDIKALNPKFRELIKLIIAKAQEFKIWEKISNDEETVYQILREVFDTKIIKLENINIQCIYNEKNITIEFYDDNIIENQIKIKSNDTKLKKKFKLFV